MENTISLSVTPVQLLLTLAFQIWIIVFPIIIIRKLNAVIAMMQDQLYSQNEPS